MVLSLLDFPQELLDNIIGIAVDNVKTLCAVCNIRLSICDGQRHVVHYAL